ncbi:sensor histidine kinase [Rubrivirga sp. S365]|uniref:sensor histidine kinase n=1 Tax=Rubrivirga sp. S365 TaxID=3076080 RepID=UPI0028C99AD3|nr:sensor histidine kinase [Rubrivirga sp. S365]MDT7858357.1 sensor histidine kinase [Rubrivirga sp. S365]
MLGGLGPGANRLPWSRATEYAAIAGFWTFLAALEVLRRAVGPLRPFGAEARPGVIVAGALIYVVWALITPLVFRLTERLPLERGRLARRLALHLAIGLVVALAVEVLNVAMIRTAVLQTMPAGVAPDATGAFPGRLGPLTAAQFEIGPIIARLRFLDDFLAYVAVLALGAARHTLVRLRDREREAADLKAEGAALVAERAELQVQLADARLAALRMQLNPHFLFNTLNAISSLAEDDPAGVQHVVARLSALLRRTLDGTARQEVPLAEELSFLHDYLDIQRVRFGDALQVNEHVDPLARDALVPTLVLQPLVENAVEHGMSGAGRGTITLSARLDGEHLVLGVQDDGPGLGASAAPAKGRSGIGLANTRARLEALYGGDARLDLTEPEAGGLLVAITLPYHTAEDLRAAAPA